MAVFDIRGTHASGKSYLLSSLLKNHKWLDITGIAKTSKTGAERERVIGYSCKELDAAIVGTYSMETMRGGCDLLFPEEVVRRVQLFNEEYSVVFLEGILVAHTFQRYSDLADEIDDYIFCFLDTPLNECIRRLDQRRSEMEESKKRPRNVTNLVKDWKQIWGSVRRKCVAAGHRVEVISHQDSYGNLMKLVKEFV